MKAIFTLWCVIAIGLQLKAEESKKIYEKKFPKGRSGRNWYFPNNLREDEK